MCASTIVALPGSTSLDVVEVGMFDHEVVSNLKMIITDVAAGSDFVIVSRCPGD